MFGELNKQKWNLMDFELNDEGLQQCALHEKFHPNSDLNKREKFV